MSVQINISGENASEAVKELSVFASYLTTSATPASVPATQPQQTASPTSQAAQQWQQPSRAPQPSATQTPYQQGGFGYQAPPAAVPTAQPQAQAQQQPQGAVPTEAASYSMDQLAVAATQLIDAGRQQDVVQLLGRFGVPALTALPKEAYGAFATELRQMGARI